jgi:hypothetical protein
VFVQKSIVLWRETVERNFGKFFALARSDFPEFNQHRVSGGSDSESRH